MELCAYTGSAVIVALLIGMALGSFVVGDIGRGVYKSRYEELDEWRKKKS